ncbi:hypothetical protein D3C84_266150 [compost metagenome]
MMIKKPLGQCSVSATLNEVDRLSRTAAQIFGFQHAYRLAGPVRAYASGSFEGDLKWTTVSVHSGLIEIQINNAMSTNIERLHSDCSPLPVRSRLSMAPTTDNFCWRQTMPVSKRSLHRLRTLFTQRPTGTTARQSFVVPVIQKNREVYWQGVKLVREALPADVVT